MKIEILIDFPNSTIYHAYTSHASYNDTFLPLACLTKDTLPAGHQFMINLLVSSLMADQGLENALITAIAYEVKDPAAILKKDRESSVHLLDLVRQLLGNASSTQMASLKHVRTAFMVTVINLKP